MFKEKVISLNKKSKKLILLLIDIVIIMLAYYLVMLFQYSSYTEIRDVFVKLPVVALIYVDRKSVV